MAKALIIHGELRAFVSCRVSSGPSAGWGCGAAALWGEWGQPQMQGEAGDSEVRFWQGEKISSSFLLGIGEKSQDASFCLEAQLKSAKTMK